jgi:hypothetical protein
MHEIPSNGSLARKSKPNRLGAGFSSPLSEGYMARHSTFFHRTSVAVNVDP